MRAGELQLMCITIMDDAKLRLDHPVFYNNQHI